MPEPADPAAGGRIVVLGAGLVGTYVGGSLHATGADVGLLGRATMRDRLSQGGLLLTDLGGGRTAVAPGALDYRDDPAMLADAALVLVTVKSGDTAEAARLIAEHAPAAVVLSLQNGIGNATELRAALPGVSVVAGTVAFNIASPEAGRLHRATDGGLMAEDEPALYPWLDAFGTAGLPIGLRAQFVRVQWGKLLLNLNNPLNALAGVPLRQELSTREYRQCLALLIEEALDALHAAGIVPARVTKAPPRLLPFVLRLPDPLFVRLAAAMLPIDPDARSSMWEDLQAGRRTEVDHLNGAVVRLAAEVGRQAPANEAIIKLIHDAEDGRAEPIPADVLYRLLTRG
jgi:2-dehydropantoate 2-reductase